MRKVRGISQDTLAKKMNLAKSTISMYEVGEREPNFETLEGFADFFNVDMNYLLGRADTREQKMKLSEIIKKHRQEHDLSQRQFAEKCGLSNLNGGLNMTTFTQRLQEATMLDISKRLKEAIRASGLSFRELEELTGIPRSAIQRYATGTTGNIPIGRIEKLAKALGVSAKKIIGWDTLPEQPQTDLTPTEQELILAYRAHPEMQAAVHRVLGMEVEALPRVTTTQRVKSR